jgi:acyl-coenzyme A thioesterase PaaI-like protein
MKLQYLFLFAIFGNIPRIRTLKTSIRTKIMNFVPINSVNDIQSNYVEEARSKTNWLDSLKEISHQKIDLQEWKDETWRKSEDGGGFEGTDFCHSPSAPVRILEYLLFEPQYSEILSNPKTELSPNIKTSFPFLIGSVHFSERSESHRGLCHGGSFCAVMDDAIGWMGFCVGGSADPWSGFTVQVNTSLKKAVPVGSVLRVEAWVDRQEGSRKFWIFSRLLDPLSEEVVVHCQGEGLFLRNLREGENSDSNKFS